MLHNDIRYKDKLQTQDTIFFFFTIYKLIFDIDKFHIDRRNKKQKQF